MGFLSIYNKRGINKITDIGLRDVFKKVIFNTVVIGLMVTKVCFLSFVLIITSIASFRTSQSINRKIINFLVEEII
ncbi:MAG: hypothetical protein IID16_08115 [Candidatus Marinimicrobia bacterium]|nr:hypothetical protein [Candidatus Neomarinimicrobiota bacterium]